MAIAQLYDVQLSSAAFEGDPAEMLRDLQRLLEDGSDTE
jgi:hypothetical protein